MQSRVATSTIAIDTDTHCAVRYCHPRLLSGGSGEAIEYGEDIALHESYLLGRPKEATRSSAVR